jgi:hypothetical protein
MARLIVYQCVNTLAEIIALRTKVMRRRAGSGQQAPTQDYSPLDKLVQTEELALNIKGLEASLVVATTFPVGHGSRRGLG